MKNITLYPRDVPTKVMGEGGRLTIYCTVGSGVEETKVSREGNFALGGVALGNFTSIGISMINWLNIHNIKIVIRRWERLK